MHSVGDLIELVKEVLQLPSVGRQIFGREVVPAKQRDRGETAIQESRQGFDSGARDIPSDGPKLAPVLPKCGLQAGTASCCTPPPRLLAHGVEEAEAEHQASVRFGFLAI